MRGNLTRNFKRILTFLCVTSVFFSTVSLTGCDGTIQSISESSATENVLFTNSEISSEYGSGSNDTVQSEKDDSQKSDTVGDCNGKAVLSDIPAYSGNPYTVINKNIPCFNKYELTVKSYETYGSLDSLGRCVGAVASCGRDIMPAEGEKRGSISLVKPSGWVQAQYDFVSGKYLYNRCHLIGWQLSAENANVRNLITGTRYMNTEGMLPFENMVADYIRETGNHVAYRVTPVYKGDNLVASGVQIEAYSVEDSGEGICFNVYCYNVQPGVEIDYSTGSSKKSPNTLNSTNRSGNNTESVSDVTDRVKVTRADEDEYVLNTNSKKIHKSNCRYAGKISSANRKSFSGSLDDLYSQGYTTCGVCF